MWKRNVLTIALGAAVVLSGVVAKHALAAAGDLTPKEARRLIARMAGIQLPSDAVRIKQVSVMGNSATVVAQVETAFRFEQATDGKWRVAEIRTGDRRWEDIDLLVQALNAEKTSRARAEMETIAAALQAYRLEHGAYVQAKTEAALIDRLNPRYLRRVIRIDPWHQPYAYEGSVSAFVLRSGGPDERVGTADDVVVSSAAGSGREIVQ